MVLMLMGDFYFLGKDHDNAAGDVSGDHDDDQGNGNGNGDDEDNDKGKAGDAVSGHHGGGSLKPQCSKPGLHSFHQQHDHHFIRLYQAKEHPPLTPQWLPWPWFTR